MLVTTLRRLMVYPVKNNEPDQKLFVDLYNYDNGGLVSITILPTVCFTDDDKHKIWMYWKNQTMDKLKKLDFERSDVFKKNDFTYYSHGYLALEGVPGYRAISMTFKKV